VLLEGAGPGPICYGGRGLRKAEINYTVSELECLAIIEGTRRYHPYLIRKPFTIITDHISLKCLASLKGGKSRLQRWALHLQQYSFTIKHKAGKLLTHADGLSRREYPKPPDAPDDLLDDSAYLSAIDNDLFECTTNKKHDEKSPKLVHEIKFVYQSPSCNTPPDNIGETDNTSSLTALSDDTDIPAAQRSCPDF